MLDLNDSVETTTNLIVVEDSESSNSSVVNADEESSVLIFDILKRGNSAAATSPELVTQLLFPVARAFSETESPVPSTHWLNLSSTRDSGGGGPAEVGALQQRQVKKSRRGPRSRSSQYRGVTFYRRTGRWESHIWDCGKQVYLGGFDTAHAAARAYDQAAIKFRGVDADINFNTSDYKEDMKQMMNLNKEEFVQVLRRQSSGFYRGGSKLRRLSLHKYRKRKAQMSQIMGTNYANEKRSETTVDASNEGNGHNLDLTIGGIFNHQLCNSSQKLNIERTKDENNGCAYGVVGQQPQLIPPSMWSGFYLTDTEKRGKEKANFNINANVDSDSDFEGNERNGSIREQEKK